MRLLTDDHARSLIRDLLDAGFENNAAELTTEERLRKAERRTDAAIKHAWQELTGQRVKGDAVDLIYGERP